MITCDSVESFNGKGKCTFFNAWMKSTDMDSITQLFIRLSNIPEKADVGMSIIEKLVKVYYGNVRNFEPFPMMSLKLNQAPMLSICIRLEQHPQVVTCGHTVIPMFFCQTPHCGGTFGRTRYASQIVYRTMILLNWRTSFPLMV